MSSLIISFRQHHINATCHEIINRLSILLIMFIEPADGTRLILHVHPTEKQTLLKGLPNEPQKYTPGKNIIFGRGENVDLFLNDQYASKTHLELTFELHQPSQQGIFKVKNIGKKLSVNNCPLITGGEHYLRPNDVIEMGQLTFTAEIVTGNDNSSFVLEFKKGSRGPDLVQLAQHQPGYHVVPQSPAQMNPYSFPGQTPQPYPHITSSNQVQQPFFPSFPGTPGMPVAFTAYPVAMQPVAPTNGSHSFTMHHQHSPPHGQVDTRREGFQSAGRSASENDDSLDARLSIEETQPPMLGSLGESFEDTHPPKK